MQVGDLVRYIPLNIHDEPDVGTGIIVKIDDNGYYEVHFPDVGLMSDLVFSELEVVYK